MSRQLETEITDAELQLHDLKTNIAEIEKATEQWRYKALRSRETHATIMKHVAKIKAEQIVDITAYERAVKSAELAKIKEVASLVQVSCLERDQKSETNKADKLTDKIALLRDEIAKYGQVIPFVRRVQ